MSPARAPSNGLAARRRRHRLAIALESLAALAAVAALWAGPFWRWDGAVRVEGNRAVPSAAILDRMGLDGRATPLFRVAPRTLEDRVVQVPGVATASVRRWLFPARLVVTVRERVPAARVAEDPRRVLDADGVAFPAASSSQVPPVVVRGAPGGLPDARRDAFRQLLAGWPAGATGTLDVTVPGDWRAVVGATPIRLGPPQDVAWKLGVFRQLAPLASGRGAGLEYLDLRYPRTPALKLVGAGEAPVRRAASPHPALSPGQVPSPREVRPVPAPRSSSPVPAPSAAPGAARP